jgi:hypothetical protein
VSNADDAGRKAKAAAKLAKIRGGADGPPVKATVVQTAKK